jgi:tRNA-splicing endonuclease subunit Sen15, fungi type
MSTTIAPTIPAPSELTTLISKTNGTADPVSALTTQVYHNLQHQHLWTSLEIHYPKIYETTLQQHDNDIVKSFSDIPDPLVSGIPPHRTYTHPDEQLYLLEIGLREEDLPSERLWVLPTTQGQSWTMHKLGNVFDALPPSSLPSLNISETTTTTTTNDKDKEAKLAQYFERRRQADERNEWGAKRILFAMVDRLMGGDGTIVYYVVHDGHVKPRQN